MSKFVLTLGPCLFNWKVNDWKDFYFKIADESSIDEVYLGEVVCYKRYPFFEVAFNDVIERLKRAKKKVHLSTYSLILSKMEVKTIKKTISYSKNQMVEVNDLGVLNMLEENPYIIGPTINVYNEGTLLAVKNQGAKRVCFPYEVDKNSLEIMARVEDIQKEIMIFGRAPLAIAARCYHARIHNRTKDDCRYVCEKDYNGKVISTLTNEDFLTVNGTQTMSFTYINLLKELHFLLEKGINIFRISPHFMNMVAVIDAYRNFLNGSISEEEAWNAIEKEMPKNSVFSNGFFHSKEGRSYIGKEGTSE